MLIEPDDDELRLFELFEVLPPGRRSELLQPLFVQTFMTLAGEEEAARYERSWGSRLSPVQPSPETLTTAFLARCMPPLPCGFCESDGFRDAYLDRAESRLRWSAVRVVLGSSELDERHVAEWTSVLCECAAEVGPDFMISFSEDTDDDDSFVGPESVQRFIQSWRETFDTALVRLAEEARSEAQSGNSFTPQSRDKSA